MGEEYINQDDVLDDFIDGKDEIDYDNLGKAMKKARLAMGDRQEDAAKIFGINRTVYTKYETGKIKPPDEEKIRKFCQKYKINFDELMKKTSIAIPDTSALLKNKRLIHMLLEDYDKVIIPETVKIELRAKKNCKDDKKLAKVASQILANIEYYSNFDDVKGRFEERQNDDYKVPNSIVNEKKNLVNDYKVAELAKAVKKETIGDVIIIHDDADFFGLGVENLKLKDYIAKRDNLLYYSEIMNLDLEFDNLEPYQKFAGTLDLNAYLPGGETLLISTIRCNDLDKMNDRGGLPIPASKIRKKVKFLLDSGVDINKNDNGGYCLPPISHCIQLKEDYGFELFKMLLEYGCDINKAARDETAASYLKVGKLNEGNTPLMIACYHAKKKFVKLLCEKKGIISLNQQDSNGYTALMKCAVQRYKRKKDDKPAEINEELYNYLIGLGADTLIRDRNNHTAEDWWKRGDNFNYKEDDIW